MPKTKSKEAYLVPAPKARWFCKVLAVKCFLECAEGPYHSTEKSDTQMISAKVQISGYVKFSAYKSNMYKFVVPLYRFAPKMKILRPCFGVPQMGV